MNQIQTGIDFNFTYGVGVTDEQILGVELAGEMWANSLGNNSQYELGTIINIHVNIDHGSELLAQEVIGGAYPAVREYQADAIYDALLKDATTKVDSLAVDKLLPANGVIDFLGVNKLLPANEVKALVNGQILTTNTLKLTTANLKSLDLIDSLNGQELDAYILLSDLSNYNDVDWNYDYLGGAQPATLDFLSTVAHEIGHTLGFISGTDRIALDLERLDLAQLGGNMTTLDLFRYSKQSSLLNINDLTIGGDSYFSLDGSQTNLAMSDARDFQGSHWVDGRVENASGLGIMNPTVALNERWAISENDIMALDAIGWDANYQSLDLQELYARAAADVDNAWRGDRTNDVNQILDIDSEVYEARRARSSRGSTSTTSYSSDRYQQESSLRSRGYSSTFSMPIGTIAENSDSETISFTHNWIASDNFHWQFFQFDFLEVNDTVIGTSVVGEYQVAQVAINTLVLDDAVESTIIDELVNSLNQPENETETTLEIVNFN